MLRTLLKRELKLGTACSAKTFYSSVQVLFSDVCILWCSKRPKKNFDMFIPQTEVKPGMRQEVNTFWNFETIHMQSVIPWYCYRLENYKLHTGRQLDAGIVWGGGGPPAGLLQYLWIFANFLWSLTSSSICEFQEYCLWLICGRESWFQVFCLAINYLDRFLAVCNIRRYVLKKLGDTKKKKVSGGKS